MKIFLKSVDNADTAVYDEHRQAENGQKNGRRKNSMKKYRPIWTVAEIHGADEWEYTYGSKKEAIAEAERVWKHLTASEKRTQDVEVRGYRPADLVAGDFAVWVIPWRNGKHINL